MAKAVEYAVKGVEIDPGSQRSRTVLALVYMFADELAAAREESEKAWALNPNSLFVLDGIGYIMTLIGHYVKFEEIREQIVRGLAECGLELE